MWFQKQCGNYINEEILRKFEKIFSPKNLKNFLNKKYFDKTYWAVKG